MLPIASMKHCSNAHTKKIEEDVDIGEEISETLTIQTAKGSCRKHRYLFVLTTSKCHHLLAIISTTI